MEQVTKAITIKASDSKDNDKIVSFFTPSGLVSAKVTGVKKAGAKLKFCAQPFCFSEIVLFEKNGFKTVTGGMLLDSFFDLCGDYTRFLCACAITESTGIFGSVNCADGFVAVLKAFKALLSARPKETLIKYMLTALKITGYEYTYSECFSCGKPHNENIWFDLAGGTVCAVCKAAHALPLSKAAAAALRIIEDTAQERLATLRLNDSALNEALSLINIILSEQNNISVKSMKQLTTSTLGE